MPTQAGLVCYEDDPDEKYFRIVFPVQDDSELDDQKWVTEGCDPKRKAIMIKVPQGDPRLSDRPEPSVRQVKGLVVSFGPSTKAEIKAMLDMADPQPGAVLLDAGCGDGAILIEAARRGVRCIGVDIDPKRIEECTRNIKLFSDKGELDHTLIHTRYENFFETDFSGVNIVTAYLKDWIVTELAKKLLPGTVLVTNISKVEDRLPVVSCNVGAHTLRMYRI